MLQIIVNVLGIALLLRFKNIVQIFKVKDCDL
jgi:hypothetical protein